MIHSFNPKKTLKQLSYSALSTTIAIPLITFSFL